MERAVLFLCLCASVESFLQKRFYYISHAATWNQAQAYCREHYTDLASIENEYEVTLLQSAVNASGSYKEAWIGLYPDPDNQTAFKWSGGGNVTFTNWALGQPEHMRGTQSRGQLTGDGKWYLHPEIDEAAFYCTNPPIVEELKSWEEALEHCRDRHADLITMRTDIHINRAKYALVAGEADRVWIGLRFLRDHWLWASGDPMMLQAWPTVDEGHQCPLQNRCGALTREGVWESTDCRERLPFMCWWGPRNMEQDPSKGTG